MREMCGEILCNYTSLVSGVLVVQVKHFSPWRLLSRLMPSVFTIKMLNSMNKKGQDHEISDQKGEKGRQGQNEGD